MKSERQEWMRNVKGTYDYLPDEQIERNRVVDQLRKIFESYGFNPIETPILSMEDVLASKYAGGAEIMKEVYTLSDQGERALGLRYDLTVPFAKFISLNKNDLSFPFKKYEIGKAYRNGPIKRGRKREFIQADVDVVGVSSIYAELEFFNMISYVANELDMKVTVKFNDRRILTRLLKLFSVPEKNMSNIILTIDKLEKLSREELVEELCEKGIANERGVELLNLLESEGNEELKTILACDELREFNKLMRMISEMNDENTRFLFTPSLARGLEVYTGTIWEVFVDHKDSLITSSIGGGGRYDNMIGNLLGIDEAYPAVGMTFGLDVIMEVMKDKGELAKKTIVDYLIIPMSGLESDLSGFSEKLRRNGIKLDVDYSGKRIKKILNRANKLNIPFVTVFGEDEVRDGKFKIKDMESGLEKEFTMSQFEEVSRYILKGRSQT